MKWLTETESPLTKSDLNALDHLYVYVWGPSKLKKGTGLQNTKHQTIEEEGNTSTEHTSV